MSKTNLNEVSMIFANKNKISIIEVDIGYIKESIHKIETNHLFHIEKDIKSIRQAIGKLEIVGSSNKPLLKMVYKVAEYILLGVVAFGLSLVLSKWDVILLIVKGHYAIWTIRTKR